MTIQLNMKTMKYNIVEGSEISKIISDLLVSFKNETIKRDVLDDEWYVVNKQNNVDSAGFCFYASEVIYRLTGGKDNWIIKRISEEDFREGPHYYLMSKIDNSILDITSDQYTKFGIEIPYEKGKGRGLQRVSIKARKLANYIGKII